MGRATGQEGQPRRVIRQASGAQAHKSRESFDFVLACRSCRRLAGAEKLNAYLGSLSQRVSWGCLLREISAIATGQTRAGSLPRADGSSNNSNREEHGATQRREPPSLRGP